MVDTLSAGCGVLPVERCIRCCPALRGRDPREQRSAPKTSTAPGVAYLATPAPAYGLAIFLAHLLQGHQSHVLLAHLHRGTSSLSKMHYQFACTRGKGRTASGVPCGLPMRQRFSLALPA